MKVGNNHISESLSHNAENPPDEGHILNSDEQAEPTQNAQTASIRSTTSKYEPSPTKGDVEKSSQEISTEDELPDPNIITWDSPSDPQNPMNWSSLWKLSNIILISALTFVTPLASSMFAPGVPALMVEFQSTNTALAGFVVSVYILGFAFGPLFLAPLSEIYGRVPVYHVCNVLFIIFTVACALARNLNMLIGFRFLAGIWGSAVLTNGGGTITDMVAQENRGAAMSGFAMGPILGPVIGPVAGGFLAQSKGWRWVFWVITMISGCFTILSFIFLRESYAPTILARKTKRLRKETNNPQLVSKLDHGLTTKDFFFRSIVRPAKLSFRSPIVLSTSIYMAIVYGYLYLLFTTFPIVFESTYRFSTGTVGLTYLGLGVGSLLGLTTFAALSDRIIKSKTAKAQAQSESDDPSSPPAQMKPEYRLPFLIPGAILIPIGLFMYGWTAQYRVHWIAPIIATSLIGIANMFIFMSINLYLVDAFTVYAASALAANTVFRSVMGAVLPLAGQQMYQTLGLGWGNSLLAFIAVGLIPVPFVLLRWGEWVRVRWQVSNL
ncbi:hypothetical protein CJF31_00002631 [Rutstroemia sp. NJR-2017a BVV2]|nr:hypothetical protein CJF31_00002631 [Rutstroemia sp. NJR-2017a BVV2]